MGEYMGPNRSADEYRAALERILAEKAARKARRRAFLRMILGNSPEEAGKVVGAFLAVMLCLVIPICMILYYVIKGIVE